MRSTLWLYLLTILFCINSVQSWGENLISNDGKPVDYYWQEGGAIGAAMFGGIRGIEGGDVAKSDFKVKTPKKGKKASVQVEITPGRKVNKVKLNQYFNNVPIYGASITVEYEEWDAEETDPYAVFGQYCDRKYLKQYIQNTIAQLDGKDLDSIIEKDLGDDAFLPLRNLVKNYAFEKSCEEWIYFMGETPHHAFMCDVYSKIDVYPDIFDWKYVIDAQNGNVLRKLNNLMDVTDINDYSGNPRMGFQDYTVSSTSAEILSDPESRVVIKDCRNIGSWGRCAHDLECATPTDCEPVDRDINQGKGAGVLAFKHAIDTFDCFMAYIGEYPVTDRPIEIRVHFAEDFDSAFFDDKHGICLGDGGDRFYPLVSISVIGHELGHGYTWQNSQLEYVSESGAMNEAYSDLAGKACQLYSTGKYEWTVGEDLWKVEGGFYRYMYDPPLDGKSIDDFKDFNPEMNVHYSSGIYNKAWYNMVENGIELVDVFRIASLANKLYWTSTSTMAQGALGLIAAAKDLNIKEDHVRDAFERVGVLDPIVTETFVSPFMLMIAVFIVATMALVIYIAFVWSKVEHNMKHEYSSAQKAISIYPSST